MQRLSFFLAGDERLLEPLQLSLILASALPQIIRNIFLVLNLASQHIDFDFQLLTFLLHRLDLGRSLVEFRARFFILAVQRSHRIL